MEDAATHERQFASRIWSRLAPDEEARVPLSVASDLLSKVGLPLHLISLPSFSSELDFEGFVTLISALRSAGKPCLVSLTGVCFAHNIAIVTSLLS